MADAVLKTRLCIGLVRDFAPPHLQWSSQVSAALLASDSRVVNCGGSGELVDGKWRAQYARVAVGEKDQLEIGMEWRWIYVKLVRARLKTVASQESVLAGLAKSWSFLWINCNADDVSGG